MNVVDTYRLPPGACFICRAPRVDVPIVDTGIDVEAGAQDHRVYLCANCVVDLFSMVTGEHDGMRRHPGVVPMARFEREAETNARLHDELDTWKALVRDGLPVVEQLVALLKAGAEVPA